MTRSGEERWLKNKCKEGGGVDGSFKYEFRFVYVFATLARALMALNGYCVSYFIIGLLM